MAAPSSKQFYRSAAWIALACLVVPMFASYYFDDMFSSISYLFEDPSLTQLGWDSSGYGLYASGYSVLCVFGGLIAGGILLDKWGVRISGSILTSVSFIWPEPREPHMDTTSGMSGESPNSAFACSLVYRPKPPRTGVPLTRRSETLL